MRYRLGGHDGEIRQGATTPQVGVLPQQFYIRDDCLVEQISYWLRGKAQVGSSGYLPAEGLLSAK
ncbi:hypothetical protein ACFLUJ_05390 [Chloroflexota bacterium]